MLAVCLVVTLAAGASMWWVPFDKTLEGMLPAGSSVPRMMEVLRDARFSNKVVFSVTASGPALSRQGLMDAAELEALLTPEHLCALGWTPEIGGRA